MGNHQSVLVVNLYLSAKHARADIADVDHASVHASGREENPKWAIIRFFVVCAACMDVLQWTKSSACRGHETKARAAGCLGEGIVNTTMPARRRGAAGVLCQRYRVRIRSQSVSDWPSVYVLLGVWGRMCHV